jgi:phage baseplate assembly protein gpV
MDFFDSVFADQDRQRRERSVHGIAVAKVTGRMGDGTYELRYLGMGGDTPSAPARMMMPNAGNKRGMYWMPEAGDEVVVGFEGGDPNAPIILGALFNAESPTPDQAKPSDENNVRTLVSRSGHEVTLDDSPSAGKVTVKTKDGRTLTLDDTPPGKVTLETPSGISIKLDDASGTLTLKAPLAIVLESASLALSVGGLSIAPGAGPPVPGTMSIALPAAVSITSAAITMNAAAITLTTTGTMPTSTVVIDGKPFGLHVHGPPPPATLPPPTPPVLP